MDDDWTESDDLGGLWEHQGRPLTVERLLMALQYVDPSAVIEIQHYDGMGRAHQLRLMHIDPRGRPVAKAVIFTTVD